MSKQLEDLSEKALGKILQYAQTAEDFVASEAPKFVREFLEYEAWYHQQWVYWGFLPCICMFIIAGIIAAFIKESGEACVGAMTGATFFLFLGFMTVPHSYIKLNKIKMAPRVYIIESLRSQGK